MSNIYVLIYFFFIGTDLFCFLWVVKEHLKKDYLLYLHKIYFTFKASCYICLCRVILDWLWLLFFL